MEKTTVIPFGGSYDINDKLYPELALSWENELTLVGLTRSFFNTLDPHTFLDKKLHNRQVR